MKIYHKQVIRTSSHTSLNHFEHFRTKGPLQLHHNTLLKWDLNTLAHYML